MAGCVCHGLNLGSLPLLPHPKPSQHSADMSLDRAQVHVHEIRGDLRLTGLVVFRTCLLIGAIRRTEIFSLFSSR